MDLMRIRKNIDDLDRMIVTLLAKRQDFVSAAARLKKDKQAVQDAKRVNEVIGKVRAKALSAGLQPDIAERVYRTIIECFVHEELSEFDRGKNRTVREPGG